MSKLQKILLGFLLILYVGIVMIIIFVHLNYRIDRSYLTLSKTNTPLTNITSYSNTTINMISKRSSQYIWCVNHYGPNNQLKDFVKCCVIAMINNYTLIIPPLYPHYRSPMRGIQWFDHFYDLKQLSLALNIVTLDQFISEKINKKKVIIDCYIRQIELVKDRMWYPQNTLISIQNTYKMNLIFHRQINVSRHLSVNDVFNKAKNCSSIFLHIHYMTLSHFFISPNLYTQSIFKHLHRTPLIKRMASALIKLLPELVINRNHSKPKFDTLAVIHMRLGDHTVMSLSMYIEQILYLIKSGVRFTHLHIMCPFLNASDIKHLIDRLPIAFTTTQHLLPHVRLMLDGFFFDILEQELAFQAQIFLASPWTTYSATVLMQKVYQEKGTVYVLSTKGKTPPLLVTRKNAKYFK